tara:strand:+ start:1550 stop:1999 length:450 start_codon:yes stop_codon:yes gene_type:complete
MTDAIVPVGHKPIVKRVAVATGILELNQDSADAIQNGLVSKGDVLEASMVAAIQAVKETPRSIPHCHIIPIESCSVVWDWEGNNLRCTVSVSAHWKTGVEMEALCGVSTGLLCAWDMVKSIEKDDKGQYPMTKIREIRVLEKRKGEAQD